MVDHGHYDALLALAKKRRSIRHFRPDPVPDEYIERIIEVARWAPSGFHSQPWEFVVIRDQTLKNEIVQASNRRRPETGASREAESHAVLPRSDFAVAPVFILLAGDWRARHRFPAHITQADETAEADVFNSSLASAFLLLHLAAASLGLASQWCTRVVRGSSGESVRRIMGLPEHIRMYDLMAVGYAAKPPIEKPLRDLAGLVHYEAPQEGEFRTPEQIGADSQKFRAWCIRAH